eukprot:NODE_2377_length_2225_cov_4.970448.p2 GENE.NODE_2377_length_2225_cov_4.970448~~NODE_2377_length_2225_cov_4.970448.p2  ORF type:complete len:403 (+),score=116.24 NODE_2377_length_2225_cov_4.970448:601-1809(+)
MPAAAATVAAAATAAAAVPAPPVAAEVVDAPGPAVPMLAGALAAPAAAAEADTAVAAVAVAPVAPLVAVPAWAPTASPAEEPVAYAAALMQAVEAPGAAARGSQAPPPEFDVMERLREVAGEDAVLWEEQRSSGARVVDGSLYRCLHVTMAGGDDAEGAVLMQDVTLGTDASRLLQAPQLLDAYDLSALLPAPLRPPARCLVVGGAGARSRLHRHPPWIACNWLVEGSVRWRFLPPDAPDLEAFAVGRCGAAASDADAFARQDAFEAVLGPGDAVVVPPGWWQQLLCASGGPTIIVAAQALDEHALPQMVSALAASAGLAPLQLSGNAGADARRFAAAVAGKSVGVPDHRSMLLSCTQKCGRNPMVSNNAMAANSVDGRGRMDVECRPAAWSNNIMAVEYVD